MESLEKSVSVKFNNKVFNVRIERDKEIDVNLDSVLKILDSNELYDYLYNYHKKKFEEINNDSYFNGKTIKSGMDLKNSIEEIKLIAYYDNVIYVCGEYWCDPEHGFSIKFPNGEFVKSKFDSFDYARDEGKESDYKISCTLLGQYSDYL